MSSDRRRGGLAGCRAVVTGGAGFIGSHLVGALLEANASVVVADRFPTGSPAHLPDDGGQVEVHRTDLRTDSLTETLLGADVVFHCAASAYVPPSVDRPLEDFETNLHITLGVLEWLRVHAQRTRLVFFSSAAVYGNPRYSPVDEDHPIDPISPYGVSKLSAERYAAVYARLYALPITSLRCFAVYGPRQRKQVIYDLMQKMQSGHGALQVLGDGTQIRDFCFVEDVARAALAVAERAPMEGETWNVGSGRGVTIRELVEAIGAALDLKPQASFTGRIRPGDPEAVVAETARLRQLGWEPRVDLRQGLAATADWLVKADRVLVG